ncbi:MAG: hypothetical protein LBU46_01005 [Candidatus Accumulibacter sp.]|nr:hypothetical protein [Accumulibacter sp.]
MVFRIPGHCEASAHIGETMYTLNFLTRWGRRPAPGWASRRIEAEDRLNCTENALTGIFSHRF